MKWALSLSEARSRSEPTRPLHDPPLSHSPVSHFSCLCFKHRLQSHWLFACLNRHFLHTLNLQFTQRAPASKNLTGLSRPGQKENLHLAQILFCLSPGLRAPALRIIWISLRISVTRWSRAWHTARSFSMTRLSARCSSSFSTVRSMV